MEVCRGHRYIPIEPAPGVNGLEPRLSIDYSGGRELQRNVDALPGDTLGYGWRVSGFSTIRRCVKDHAAEAAIVSMRDTDSLCLDGEPLVLINGQHLREGAEYRTLRESFAKVVLKGSVLESWFEVRSPDGAVSEYGRTDDSRLRNVVYVGEEPFHAIVPTVPFAWSVNKRTDAFDNEMVYTYHEDEVAGVRHPAQIRYGDGGDATVSFDYVNRKDLSPVTFGTVSQDRKLLLHTVRVALDGKPVRTYNLRSNQTDGKPRHLKQIQLCGFGENGDERGKACLKPVAVAWTGTNSDAALSNITDPLGRVTAFEYGDLTAANRPFLFTERPFGAVPALPLHTKPVVSDGNSAQRQASLKTSVVVRVKRTNGLTAPGN